MHSIQIGRTSHYFVKMVVTYVIFYCPNLIFEGGIGGQKGLEKEVREGLILIKDVTNWLYEMAKVA